ncbi:MAG: cation:proton antiporter [Pseudomonadota bacterium]
MHDQSIVFSIVLIFAGAAVFATVALYLRQAMLVAYLALGVVLGPWVTGLVSDAELIQEMARIGIIFLLFLLGLNLIPAKLLQLLKATTLVTLFSTLIFAGFAIGVASAFGFRGNDLTLIGICAAFSSTIIGLKLLPTTVLHHRHTGEVIISVLLLQDLLAILAMLLIQGGGELPLIDAGLKILALPVVIALAWAGQRYILLPLLVRFDRIQEYVFLLAIGWCLGIAQLAHTVGLSHESGAFIAGIVLASSPISLHIAESLKPLRDFFLVLFFFALGAGIDPSALSQIWLPALLIGVGLLAIKPVVFRFLLVRQSESNKLGWETGVRLGQMSEFSLLIVFVAVQNQFASTDAVYLVQFATILSFVISTYWIVMKYPTPIAVDESLRRD